MERLSTFFRRLKWPSLGILVIAAALAACRDSTKNAVEKTLSPVTATDSPGQAAPSQPPPRKPERQPPRPKLPKDVDFKTYEPPEALGVIYGDRHFTPGAKKTIVYITDFHGEPGMGGETDEIEMGFRAQVEIFRIVEDIMSKQTGPVTLLIESWPEGKGAEFLKNMDIGKTNRPQLVDVAQTTDPEARTQKAYSYLGTGDNPAGDLLAATYPDRIKPLGVETDAIAKARRVLQAEVALVVQWVDTGEMDCTEVDPGIKGPLQLRQALEKDLEELTPDDKSCLCKTADIRTSTGNDFIRERLKIGALEAEKAADDPSAVTVIIAGAQHLVPSLEIFQGRGVNHIVISPRVIARNLSEYLRDIEPKGRESLSPEAQRLCSGIPPVNPNAYKKIRDRAKSLARNQ